MACFCSQALLAEPLTDQLSRQYEEFLLTRLAEVQQSPNRLREFSSDGCSAGMSAGWQMFAEWMPGFKAQFGDKPPWEQCCISHDHVYWWGETEDGFAKRQQADLKLKQCVIDLGQAMKGDLAVKYGVSEQQVVDHFTVAAGLMYGAVRAGGQPCSLFPWRWGYGWPLCPIVDQ